MRDPGHCVRFASSFRVWIAITALAMPLAAHARGQFYGFVRADDPSAESYAPDPAFAYNDAGPRPQITRAGIGQYAVEFPGLSALGWTTNVQVTAYGTDTNYCKVAGWGGDAVSVACFDIAGHPADTRFTLLYLLPRGPHAFAVADQSTNPSYTPDPAYSYAVGIPWGITASRSGTGSYSMYWVGFPWPNAETTHVHVTAHGAGNARCRTESMFPLVRCFDPSGAPVDSTYSILYWAPYAGDPGLAFAQADQPGRSSYWPSADRSFNAGGGEITATRSSMGVYSMTWAGMAGIGINGGNIQVTANDASGSSADVLCKVASWTADSASVRCFDTGGNPVDATYNVLFVKPPKKLWTQDYAFANVGASGYVYDSYNPSRQSVSATHPASGVWSVQFESFSAFPGGGNVQVTVEGGLGVGAGAGNDGEYCKVKSWAAETVDVLCFDASGAPANPKFNVFYLKTPSHPATVAYAFADDTSAASYTPSSLYAYNPAGGAITATRSGTGVYTMTWTGFGALVAGGGHPNVTASDSSNKRCQIASWSGDSVHVRCYSSSGAPADSPYSVLYLRPDADNEEIAFAWANDATASSYTPSAPDSFNSGDGPITIERYDTGIYRLIFDRFGERGFGNGIVLVSGHGSTDQPCATDGWSWDVVHVVCHDSAGNRVDSRFHVMYIYPVAVPEPDRFVLLASGIALVSSLARVQRSKPNARNALRTAVSASSRRTSARTAGRPIRDAGTAKS
jgi:hypothetical protein